MEKQQLRLWTPDLEEQVGELLGHEQKALSLSFSADGQLLASGTDDPWVAIWNVPGRGLHRKIVVGELGIAALALSPDGQVLATLHNPEVAPDECRVRLWTVDTGQELPALLADSTAAVAVAFSSDGQRLAVGTRTGDIIIWDTSSGEKLAMRQFDASRAVDLAFRSQDDELVVCRERGVIQILKANSLQETGSWQRPEERFRRMRLSPNGAIAAIGTSSGVVRLWNGDAGQEIAVIEVDDVKGVRSLSFSADGRRLIAGGAIPNCGVKRCLFSRFKGR